MTKKITVLMKNTPTGVGAAVNLEGITTSGEILQGIHTICRDLSRRTSMKLDDIFSAIADIELNIKVSTEDYRGELSDSELGARMLAMSEKAQE